MSTHILDSTNYRDDIAALQELKWKAAAWEDHKISQLLSSDEKQSPLKITFGKEVVSSDVTAYSMAVIKALMLLADIRALEINSAYRAPEEQARVMFDNLEAGTRIKYAKPGAAVTAKYDAAKQAGSRSDQIKSLMINEIYRLGPEDVSKHASPPDWLNVVDIRPSSIPSSHRLKFVKVTNRLVGTYISKFLHSGNSKDKAFHIEIPQGKSIMARQAAPAT